GGTGAMDYAGIARGVAALDPGSRGALFLALVLVLAGFGYKIASVPFHMWAPDVYTGAPIPVTAFLAVGSKAAGFAMLLRFFHFGVGHDGVTAAAAAMPLPQLASVLCVATMTLGNLAALSQTNMKRLLAYSSIAHAGYALLGFVVFADKGLEALLFYLVAYYLMNLGAFWVVMLIANATGREALDGYRGLARRGASERTSWGPWACSRSRPSSSASTSTGCSAGSRSRAGSSPAEGGRPVAAGTLYVVATPIGNLEDVTLRALRVLREVDLIAAEDTRRTRTLLGRHGIARPLTSYYDAVERDRAPVIVARLQAGASVALVP